MFFSNGLLS